MIINTAPSRKATLLKLTTMSMASELPSTRAEISSVTMVLAPRIVTFENETATPPDADTAHDDELLPIV